MDVNTKHIHNSGLCVTKVVEKKREWIYFAEIKLTSNGAASSKAFHLLKLLLVLPGGDLFFRFWRGKRTYSMISAYTTLRLFFSFSKQPQRTLMLSCAKDPVCRRRRGASVLDKYLPIYIRYLPIIPAPSSLLK